MLSFQNLALRRGPRQLFQDVTFTVYAGQKIGITGANGTGKSSLFSLILGDLSPDAGNLERSPGLLLSHVEQEIPETDRAAVDYVIDGHPHWAKLHEDLAAAQASGDGEQLARVHQQMEAAGAYGANAQGARLLAGLGFKPGQEQTPVNHFSGGWRMRLNLARALMCPSDLMLLDEPTNHLDLDAVIWLEDWLKSYPGALLLISHDRDFLDRVVDHVAHVEGGRVTLYAGNYSAFEKQRAARLAQQQALYVKQQQQVVQIRAFVDRFRAKATKARQAQSRLKALQRMELIAPAHVDSPFSFRFREPAGLSNPMLKLEHADAGYEDTVVVGDVTLTIAPGDRLALLGPNGAGKSTLIRTLAGQLAPVTGSRHAAKDLAAGYFAQYQLEQLDGAASPLLHLQRLDPRADDQALRDFLGGFGFSGERATDPVAPLSGGEKARLVLALTVYKRPNLLLLDEPTNHLDLDMRDALALALQDFSGAVVVISHDRSLLRLVCDRFLLVSNGRAEPFDGDLEDYRRWLTQRHAAPGGKPPAVDSAPSRKDARRQAAEQRQRLQPLKKKLQQLESRLDTLHRKQKDLETQLAEPEIYQEEHKARLKQLLHDKAAADRAVEDVEQEWLEVSEALELAQGQD